MDRILKRFDVTKDRDLGLCLHRGVAYQLDMSKKFSYDAAYHDHYKALEGSAVANALNHARCAMLQRHAAPGATVLDIGAGCGTFVRTARSWGFETKGFDVIPKTVDHLKEIGAYAEDPGPFDAVTFWDSLEHIDAPEAVLKHVRRGALVLVAIPLFEDLARIRDSKHYKPGEHLYYFTRAGFLDWMATYGFRMVEESTHEVDAGRDSIGAFAFRRDLPGYQEHVAAYQEMHATRFYGSSATELHLENAAKVVKRVKPRSILDYGCGRSDLAAHFWADGARKIARYDPAIPEVKRMPEGFFDLALCCDVMEHIPLDSVDRVLSEIRAKSPRAFFTISTKLARAKLPDGRNAHVTLLTGKEWKRWISSVFGSVTSLPSKWEHELVFLAGPA